MEWFNILDLDNFTDKLRVLVFNKFGSSDDNSSVEALMYDLKPEEQEECDLILSHQEAKNLILALVKTDTVDSNIIHSVNNNILCDIIESLNERMTSNILNSLVNKGLVETAFDSNCNDFVFWIKNDISTNKKSETN